MKPLVHALGRAVDELLATSPSATATAEALDECGYPPPLPADLRGQVDLLAGRVRFGDFRMAAEPTHHPQAERFATTLRAALDPPAPDTIAGWIVTLAQYFEHPVTDAELSMIVLALGNLPATCWTEKTLADAVGAFTFWPKIAELKPLLQSEADWIRADLRALERIAAATAMRPSARACEAHGYDPGPAGPERLPHDPMPKSKQENACEPVRSVEGQLAALAFKRGIAPTRRPPSPASATSSLSVAVKNADRHR